MDKYSVPICSIRVSEGMRRDWEAGLFVTFVTNSFEACIQKAIYLYHKSVEETQRHSLITSSYLRQFRFGASV